MSTRMRDVLGAVFATLRYEPTTKRLRAWLDDEPVADTADGRLVWEPRRVVPTYAVPVSDVSTRLVPADTAAPTDKPFLDPTVAFEHHTCDGTSFDVVATTGRRRAAAFRPADSDLADYVLLDFGAFTWREEDEPIVGHPHDPFRRIDVLRSRRHVRLELDGRVLAESTEPLLLFETLLPVRFYLSRDDVIVGLEPSDTVSYCAYKGRATYFSVPGGPPDIAWSYRDPLHDGEPVRDRLAFFDERLDVIIDGQLRQSTRAG